MSTTKWRRSSTCADGSCVEVAWQSACASSNCVEVACSGGQVLVRDSKLGEESPVVAFAVRDWQDVLDDFRIGRAGREWFYFAELSFNDAEKTAFVAGVRRGEFDHLTAEWRSAALADVDPDTETQTMPQPVSVELSPVGGPVPVDDHPAVRADEPRTKTNYIGSPASLLLDQALMVVHAAFPDALGIYQVGSSLERPDWRDIDVRLMLADDDFERLFGDPRHMGRINAMWSLFCGAVSRQLSTQTGLPIDFQIQGMTRANILHKGPREPIGTFVAARTIDPKEITRG